ncbi:MAG: hypothetical protein K0R00_177 [Herbinix sp.]|jgi:hypothetical protein|nr:hypothetical protein [Herbinix sp.]
MGSIKDIKSQGKSYTKKCVSHAVAMLYLIDIADAENMADFLDSVCKETLFNLSRITDEMETALHLSSSVGLNTFVYMLSQRGGQASSIINDDIFTNAQCTFGESNEKMQELKLILSSKYGENFKTSGQKSKELVQEISLYNYEEHINSSFTEVFSGVTKNHSHVAELTKSSGITFIDKYEFTLQHMINEAMKLKSMLQATDFLMDVMAIVLLTWREYCDCNEAQFLDLLSNQSKDIENEMHQLLVERG